MRAPQNLGVISAASHTGQSLTLIDGEALFRAGQVARFIYLIEQGSLVIITAHNDQILRRYDQYELIGIPEVMAGTPWPATAIARGNTRIRVFSADCLNDCLTDIPPDSQAFLAELSALCA